MIKKILKEPQVLIVAIAIVALGVSFGSLEKTESPGVTKTYHQTQFSEYTKFAEASIEHSRTDKRIDLEHVLGAVASHHIPTTIPTLAELYIKLGNTRNVKTFVIIGPDHIDQSKGDINVSKADFVMPFGVLKPNMEIIEKLEQTGFVVNHEEPFEKEHSIGSQLLLISNLFPEAKVVPLIFRSSLTNETAEEFGKALARSVDGDTFVIASVDFSHYLPVQQARPIDSLSANVLSAMSLGSAALIEADSIQSLVALMSYLEEKKANQFMNMQVLNTRDYNTNNDNTTGYVFGFWGIGNTSTTTP